MKHLNKEKISELVKHGRTTKGLTQQELADATKISLRSVQRIENAEVLPRLYTLKLLARQLGFLHELDTPQIEEQDITVPTKPALNKARKLILTIGAAILLILLTSAFLSQSANFPETTFELFLLIAFLILIYAAILWRIWR